MTLSDHQHPNGETLSTTEVQRETGLTRHEVYEMIKSGRLRTRHLGRFKHYRVYRESVDDLKAELRRSA